MKRYNLSQIMKRVHNLYNNARAKYPTFSDALRKSWKMAKFNVQVTESIKAIDAEKEAQEAKEQEAREQAAIRSILFTAEQEAQRIKREAEAKAQRMRNEIAARKAGISYAEYQNRISRSMGYGYERNELTIVVTDRFMLTKGLLTIGRSLLLAHIQTIN